MWNKIKPILRGLYIFVSIIAIIFTIFCFSAVGSRFNTSFFSLPKFGDKTNKYLSTAVIASVPADVAKNNPAVVKIGTVDLNLEVGDVAYLQFSVLNDSVQNNWKVTYLFDPTIVQAGTDNYGVRIVALKAGSTPLQAFIDGEFKNVATINVTDKE